MKHECKDCEREISYKGYCESCVRDSGAIRRRSSRRSYYRKNSPSPSFENAVRVMEDRALNAMLLG